MAKWQDDARDLDWSVLEQGKTFHGTPGNDHLVGTAFHDIFHIGQGGNDHVEGGKRGDTIYAGASLTSDDRINGGAGNDMLVLKGDYSSGLTLQTNTISRVEGMKLQGEFDYSITMAPDMRHDRGSFVVDASTAHSLHLDGSAMDFELALLAGGGDDVLIGGSGLDAMAGGLGHDVLTGNAGKDFFYFDLTSDSVPSNPDVITDFAGDVIGLSEIDGDTQKKGHQDLHFGATPGHTGDVTLTYDADQNVTFVNVFTDKDASPDMVIQLTGNHTDLTQTNFLF